MRRVRPIGIFALAMLAGCGDSPAGRGVGDEPPATVATGAGEALQQAALGLAGGEAAASAARRVRGATPDPATARFAATVAADHDALERLLRGTADGIPDVEIEARDLPSVSDTTYLRWQAALDSILMLHLAEEPATGLGDAALREVLRQAVPTIAAHRQRALQLADSLGRLVPDTLGAGPAGG